MRSRKRILFITGTRADFGKLKPLIRAVEKSLDFDYQIFGTGMHMMAKYGNTILEIKRSGFTELFTYLNQVEGDDMEVILANTVTGLSRYLHENKFDLIVVHGDRPEALSGALVGALRNVRVAHIEGGEISGTIDELMRHAISKLSHLHFVASDVAKKRLIQLGEVPETIFCIGSPDVDVMLSSDLPSREEAFNRYQIEFEGYAFAILHPVTTELGSQEKHARIFVDSLLATNHNFVVIYPNNDSGSEYIFTQLERLRDLPNFRIFPSIRFEYFLTLLKYADYIIGNSSAGIHEAPVYGVPTLNIGTRQDRRFSYQSITNLTFDIDTIVTACHSASNIRRYPPTEHYGNGKSAIKFMEALRGDVWSVSSQKRFKDLGELNV